MKRILPAFALFGLAMLAPCLHADESPRPRQAGGGSQESVPSIANLQPVPLADGAAKLGPSNTRVTFVGLHEGDDPKPRLGGFSELAGRAEVGPSGELTRVVLDIKTGSLWTEIDRLTAHLKSPDFFDVRQYPEANFESTAITPGTVPDRYTIRGKLTMLGKTKEIELPATVQVMDRGLVLASDFAFDRRQFGMEYGQGQVKNDVTVKIRIGEPAQGAGGPAGKGSAVPSGN